MMNLKYITLESGLLWFLFKITFQDGPSFRTLFIVVGYSIFLFVWLLSNIYDINTVNISSIKSYEGLYSSGP